MQYAKRVKLTGLRGKREANYGVDPTLAVTNAIRAWNGKLELGSDVHPNEFTTEKFGYHGGVVGARRGKLSFNTFLVGNGNITGVIGNASENDPLLWCAGFDIDYNAESGPGVGDGNVVASYDASTTGTLQSSAFEFFMDGHKVVLLGGVADLTITADKGRPLVAAWDVYGIFATPTDTAMAGAFTWNTSKAPAVLGSGNWTIGAYAAAIDKLTLKLGNKVEEIGNFNAPTGVDHYQIMDCDIRATCNPLQVPVATQDFWASFLAQTEVAFAGSVGSTNGYILNISGSKCVCANPPAFDTDGNSRRYGIELAFPRDLAVPATAPLVLTFH